MDANSVFLNSTDPPDGFMQLATAVLGVEVTEALEPGRRRGHEYKNPEPDVTSIDEERLSFFEREFSSWAATAAQRKLDIQGRLSLNTIVLIHLSAWLFFLEPEEIWERLFRAFPQPFGNVVGFAVIHSSEVYLPAGLGHQRFVTIPSYNSASASR
jgi:hypothetical protein